MPKPSAKRCPRCGLRPQYSRRDVLNVRLTRAHCGCVPSAPLEAFAESRTRAIVMWNAVVDQARSTSSRQACREPRRTAANVPVGHLGKVRA